ncbi:hypothetical protein ANCCAN_01034 [Ancylostoma caninum]|uniref:Uncharacterized protein n=1 Tax=Ancylostoma caninum TaxID=29170 RepID=A0A368HAB6_ANCCA|nr:hypothetical protein ANCCAN_01034 [Ancylostoma caninum]
MGANDTLFSNPIVVWMQRCGSYVESIPNVLLRIKHPTEFGEDTRGIPDYSGELMDVNLELIMSFRPTVIEITHSRNPLSNLNKALEHVEGSKVKEFFGRVKLLSLDRADVALSDLISLLQRISLLEGFSFSELNFSQKDWKLLLPEFQRLSVRAMDISQDVLNSVLDKLNVELVKLSGCPGIKISSIMACCSTFITVTSLIVQELDYTNDRDAEDLITCIEAKFPRLKTLIWDWSIVDPAVTFDERSRAVISGLVNLFRKLNLQCFVIVLYTPCNDTKYASGELARLLTEAELPSVQLYRFASKGLSKGHDNFTVISAGEDGETRTKVHSIFVDGRTSAPDLRYLLQLIDDFSPPLNPVRVVEFGGFDADEVRRSFSSKEQ